MRQEAMMRFVLVALGLLVAACASPTPSPTPTAHTLTGTMTLHDTGEWTGSSMGDSCSGQGGFSDMTAGLQVVVRDGDGSTLAVGELGAGEFVALGKCEFDLTVSGIPDSAFYAIEVGDRGELTYTAAEMETMDWEVVFVLGD